MFVAESVPASARATIAPVNSHGAITAHPPPTALTMIAAIVEERVSQVKINSKQACTQSTHDNEQSNPSHTLHTLQSFPVPFRNYRYYIKYF